MSEDSEVPTVMYYRGRDIRDMNRDELVDALGVMARLYEGVLREHDATWRMWEEFKETQTPERTSRPTSTWGRAVSEMVDRVAMTIAKDLLKQWTARPRPAFDPEAFARVAIAAMREPTPGMIAAAVMGDIPKATAIHCWHVMIDETLKPVPYA